MRYSSIEAIGSFVALEAAVDTTTDDYLKLDPAKCTGGVDATLRTDVEDAPGQDGSLIEPGMDGAWIISLGGEFVIKTAGDDAGYFAAIDTILASLKSSLDALKAAPDDLVHSAGTLTVWKYASIADGWENLTKTVTFSVIVDVFA